MTRVGSTTTSAFGTRAAASACQSLRKPEDRRRRAELLGEVRERRHADPASDEEWLLDVQPIAVSERPEDVDRLAGLDRCERPRSGPDRLQQEGQLAGRCLAEAHRPRQDATRRLEHEELSGDARIEPSALETKQRVGPNGLVGDDVKRFSSAH